MNELRFQYKCAYCGKQVRMNHKDIIKFIGERYGTPDGDQLEDFFDSYGKSSNLCGKCARGEGFEKANDFEGWEDEDGQLTI